jgi:asparagine synthase (glutamine-hydrolysing)
MTGIAALFQLDGKSCAGRLLERVATAIPGGGLIGHAPWTVHVDEEGSVGLARRLARFTPEDEHEVQPLRRGAMVLVADARLDNRNDLHAKLGLSTRGTSRIPDSLLIWHAYQRWGERSPEQLLGEFAFVVWDKRAGRLFCARDHRGKRPLFYHHSGNCLAVASSPQGLLALPHASRRLCRTALADFLVRIGDASSTLFEGIRRIPAAHWLSATAAGICVREYWTPSPYRLQLSSGEEYLEAFREVFFEAVQCRLRSNYVVGSFLSGGLDSSSVASVAACALATSGARVPTFTAVPREGFDGPDVPGHLSDESPLVEALCALHTNIDPTFVRAPGLTFLSGLEPFFERTGTPIGNAVNRVWIQAILEEAAARCVHVLLHGQEGNHWISYRGRAHLPFLTRQGRWVELLRELRAFGCERGARAFLSVFKHAVILPLLPEPLWRFHQLGRSGPEPWSEYAPINPLFAKTTGLLERFYESPASPLHSVLRGGDEARIAAASSGWMQFDSDCYGALRAGYGIDLRDPTADKRVIEFCLSVPSELYFQNGQDRLLVRRGMQALLPQEVVWSRKRGLQAADWFEWLTLVRSEIAAEIMRLERSDLAHQALDLARMRHLLNAWPVGGWNKRGTMNDYLFVLANGVATGRFIRWFEERYS